MTPDNFDWKHPEYGPIIVERFRRLQYIRENPDILPDLKRYYRDAPWQFLTVLADCRLIGYRRFSSY